MQERYRMRSGTPYCVSIKNSDRGKEGNMKTIQEVLRELDAKELRTRYFEENKKDLIELADSKIRISEYVETLYEKFGQYLQKLRHMETKAPITEEDSGILYVHKTMREEGWLPGLTVDLVHRDELLSCKDLSNVPAYGYEVTAQEQALRFLVADTELTQNHLYEIAVSFLSEMSFFGYDQEHLPDFKARLDEAMEEVNSHPERLVRYEPEAFRKEMGLPEEETYPKEEELCDTIHHALQAYDLYCNRIELERIKEGLLSNMSKRSVCT